jgi:hypothetical protein
LEGRGRRIEVIDLHWVKNARPYLKKITKKSWRSGSSSNTQENKRSL